MVTIHSIVVHLGVLAVEEGEGLLDRALALAGGALALTAGSTYIGALALAWGRSRVRTRARSRVIEIAAAVALAQDIVPAQGLRLPGYLVPFTIGQVLARQGRIILQYVAAQELLAAVGDLVHHRARHALADLEQGLEHPGRVGLPSIQRDELVAPSSLQPGPGRLNGIEVG